jgi:ABC-type nitrate/sulfonate/bicarbonate transport system permease component
MSWIEFAQKNQALMFDCLLRHIELVGISVVAGMIISIPLGIFLSRYRKLANIVLSFVGLIQTIPGLSCLGLRWFSWESACFPPCCSDTVCSAADSEKYLHGDHQGG